MGQYNIGRRRSFGRDLKAQADFIETALVESQGRMLEEVEEQWGVLSGRESDVLKDARQDLRKCVKRLRVLQKRCSA